MSAKFRMDHSPEGLPEDEKRPELSRRSVLHGAAGLAGTGLAATALASTLAGPASAAAAPRAHPGWAAGAPSPGEPVIVHVRDLKSGEMDVFAGESKVRLRDPGLAARLSQAVR